MKNVLALILGGGRGTRLYPLTKYRAKPAVPIGGKFRLIDIPISNCIHWDIRKIFVLTQFNSLSLHRHINNTYNFDGFSHGFVQILAAQQTMDNLNWYQGTADAVRKNIGYFRNTDVDYVVILSGDQLFRINLYEMIEEHRQRSADVTVASIAVEREKASSFGILKCDGSDCITDFVEKPQEKDVLDILCRSGDISDGSGVEKPYLASMGLYVFNRDVLIELLEKNESQDFGKEIIPLSVKTHRVFSYSFSGYWEDIGTIKSFFEANLDFASIDPRFNFYDENYPIFTHARFLPGSKIRNCHIDGSVLADGSIIEGSEIRGSIIGLRTSIGEGTILDRVVTMGADFYEHDKPADGIKIGIGRQCRIRNAILDKDVRIGDRVVIDYQGKKAVPADASWSIVDGIVVVPKKGLIPAGTVIE